jgi:hypothetical protein
LKASRKIEVYVEGEDQPYFVFSSSSQYIPVKQLGLGRPRGSQTALSTNFPQVELLVGMKHVDHFLNDATILPTVYLNESRLVLMQSPPLFLPLSYTIRHRSFAGALPNSELEF